MRFDSAVPVKIRDAYVARTEPEAVRILGCVYWVFVIVGTAFLVVGGIGYGLWEFAQPYDANVAESVTTGSKKTFSKSAVQKVLQAFDDRAVEYSRRRVAPVMRDPS